ncbi:ATP-binding protein, partial [Escherichia coli]
NTMYQILSQIEANGIPFLVIEPAKGEYKHVFGHHPRVRVYGTNPAHAELLRINPFRFPEAIHVLEHVDRLIEIFSVCWPMYAAMPAVLKEALLLAYEQCGWDLDLSVNRRHADLYPSFGDLLATLR